MALLIDFLVDSIYAEPRSGRPLPARIKLGPNLFSQFQMEHREGLAALAPEADNFYPGSLAAVPVVKVSTPGTALVRLAGERAALPITE